ncbi:MAG: hypothetical protein HOQ02_04045 [Lysobacter sp.]|nr:hypothetical protein [Lysobacter sp.]
MSGIADYTLACRRLRDDVLRADVAGRRTPATVRAYWEDILAEVHAQPPRRLLVVDELRGPELSADQWYALVEAMRGRGLEGVRIAHVRPAGIAQLEYCEIHARAAGLDARVFDDLAAAERWLRYGTPDLATARTRTVPTGIQRP